MKKQIAIHGGGYVGLTAAVHYAKADWNVLIYDPVFQVAAAINNGKPRSGEFLSYMNVDIQKLVDLGKLRATTDFQDVISFQVHSIAVPTEKAGIPNDEYVTQSLNAISAQCKRPLTVLIESTLTPGFIDGWLRSKHGSMYCDLYLAACPRRDWFADKNKNLRNLPRVVGGVNEESTNKAVEVLQTVSPNIYVTDYRTAELCKALENALLHVQVMFGHQLAYALPDRNVAEALRLAGTHWRLTPIHLGFGTGGRCVPLGTQYLLKAAEVAKVDLSIGFEAREWDQAQRKIIATLADKNTKSDGRILIMGAAYRPDFKDAGLSPGIAIAKELKRRGRIVTVLDPYFSHNELESLLGFNLDVRQRYTYEYSTILLATPHKAYQEPPFTNGINDPKSQIKYILDAQGTWKEHDAWFKGKGIKYRIVGTPGWMD